MIASSPDKQNIPPGQFALHADLGTSMNSVTVAHHISELALTKPHRRPHVSRRQVVLKKTHFKTSEAHADFS